MAAEHESEVDVHHAPVSLDQDVPVVPATKGKLHVSCSSTIAYGHIDTCRLAAPSTHHAPVSLDQDVPVVSV